MSQSNVFANTADTKTIIRFVKEIERHPCLYDRKSPKYMDRDFRRKSWKYIAKKANSTVAECKEKWTKIRTAYIRTLRPTYVGGVPTYSRPYYLASYLKFIPPVTKKPACKYARPPKSDSKDETNEPVTTIEVEESGDSEDNLDSEDDKTSQQEVPLNDEDNSIDFDDDDVEGYDNLVIEIKDPDTNEENKTKVKENINISENNSEKTDEIETKRHPQPFGENFEKNPRKMFLFSILPDIEDLNEEQMRSFRREVIRLIERVTFDY